MGKSHTILVKKGKKYYWCSCGLSKSQPFCDGSHKVTGYSNVPYKAIKDEIVFFVVVKRVLTNLYVTHNQTVSLIKLFHT